MSVLSYDQSALVLFFKGLANETRLQILESLSQQSMTVSEISKSLGFEQSRVSHNLSCLEFCGFVTSRRDGKKKIYTLNGETVAPLLAIADGHIKQHGRNLLQCKVLKR
ncbi:MAG: ArsR/SmtB family transcription factor [Candidatus Thorarchaeota archaeon]